MDTIDKLGIEVVAETEKFEREMANVKELAEGLGDALQGAGGKLRLGDNVVRETNAALAAAEKLARGITDVQREANAPLAVQKVQQYASAVDDARKQVEKLAREQAGLKTSTPSLPIPSAPASAFAPQVAPVPPTLAPRTVPQRIPPVSSDDFIRETTRAQEKILQLQQSFRTLKAPNLGADFARETDRAMRSADKLQTTMVALNRQAEKPLSTESLQRYENAVERVRRETKKLEREQIALRNKAVRADGGANNNRGGLRGAAGSIADDALGAVGINIPIGAGAAAAAGGGIAAGVIATKAAYDAGRELERSNRLIASSAKESGIAYGELTKNAREFAELTAQTRTEGQKTFAELTRLAQAAGRTNDLDLIGKRFADIGAARGLKGDELSTIAEQLITGQDEALNRLGIADPSKLYEQFAKDVGRTVESLTEMERANIRLDAVMRKAILFDGTAAAQLLTATGQMDKFFANVKDKGAQFGADMTKLAEPLFRFVNAFEIKDVVTFGLSTAIRADAQTAADKELQTWQQIHKTIQDAHKSVEDTLKAADKAHEVARSIIRNDPIYTDPLKLYNKVREAEKGGNFFDAVKAQKEFNAFRDSLPEDRRKGLDNEISKYRAGEADSRQKELEQQNQQAERRKQEAEKFKREQDEAMNKLKERRKLTETFFDSLNSYAGNNNPYVKIFSEAENLAAKVNEQFKTLGKDAVAEMDRVQRKALDVEQQRLRIETSQRGVGYQFDVKKLEAPQLGLNAEQERRFGIYNKQFDAADKNFGLRREREAYERGGVVDKTQLQREMFEQYQAVKRGFAGDGATLIDAIGRGAKIDSSLAITAATDGLNQEKQKRADEYVLEQTKGLSVDARFSDDFRVRQLADDRAQALRRQEDRNAQEIGNEQKRAEVGRFAVNEANAKLADLSKFGGIANDEVRKQYLAVTGALDPKELTPELRAGRIKAIQEEAKQDAKKEQEAKIEVEKAKVFREKILTGIDNLAGAVASKNQEVILKIKNETSARVDDSGLGKAY